MLILEVFDINFHRYGLVENYSMAQYVQYAQSVGSFTINCDASKDNIELLKTDRVIWLENDIAGIIQYVNIDSDDTTKFVIKGKLLTVILEWRYVYPTIDVSSMSPNKIVEKYVTDNCINASESKRNFSFLELEKSTFELDKIAKEKTGDTVEEAIEELLSSDGVNEQLMFNIGFYPRKEKFIFYIRLGKDRTKGNSEGNKLVLFSQDLRNIMKSSYEKNVEDYRNTAIVMGEDADKNRKSLLVYSGTESSGYDRREIYVDARDIQSESTDDEGNTTTISESEYNAKLKQRGLEQLGDCLNVESYEGTITTDSEATFRFGIDYNIGDKVDIIDTTMSVKLSAIVTGVTVTQENGDYSVEPQFGFTQPTIYQKLKKKGVI